MRYFTTLYLLLLGYIIAALVFWGTSLRKQSEQIYTQELIILNTSVDSTYNSAFYKNRLTELTDKRDRRTKQYFGEGATFLLVILIGAAVVFTSFKRSIRLSRQQNNFMLSVTHELKSPIAAMKLNIQTLQKYQLDEDKKQQLMDRCIKEANRLNDLCNNMLLASQMEGRQYIPAKEQLSFTDIVDDSVRDYASRYPGRMEEGILQNSDLMGDKLLLQMAVNNLLENAIKYTPSDKPIQVTLTNKNKMAILQVADQGPGIPDKEKGKIFNKFYRVGNEETRKSKGTGLGLYLTAKIVQQHKGRIYIKDNSPSGAIFEICLPVS
ncbi:MAG: HAMP domain-containing histidine kinase [Sphingobacteriales bacterium]|nr:MAG: HAMP domain-containing histidine kinase [Sphingobacteriales bacterium]